MKEAAFSDGLLHFSYFLSTIAIATLAVNTLSNATTALLAGWDQRTGQLKVSIPFRF
jgi:hypothetical protein